MYLQTLTKLVPSLPMPVVPLQILDLALSVLDISPTRAGAPSLPRVADKSLYAYLLIQY